MPCYTPIKSDKQTSRELWSLFTIEPWVRDHRVGSGLTVVQIVPASREPSRVGWSALRICATVCGNEGGGPPLVPVRSSLRSGTPYIPP